LPLSYAVLHSVEETAVIDISIAPHENTMLVFRFVIDEFTKINVTIDVLHASAVLAVVLKMTFVKAKR